MGSVEWRKTNLQLSKIKMSKIRLGEGGGVSTNLNNVFKSSVFSRGSDLTTPNVCLSVSYHYVIDYIIDYRISYRIGYRIALINRLQQ